MPNKKKLLRILQQGVNQWNDLVRDVDDDGYSPRYSMYVGQVDFSGADLSGADLFGADLGQVNLEGANLSGATLTNTILSAANLSAANLSEASLVIADLTGAKLNNADLRFADFNSADLRFADLAGADLTGASLIGANLTSASLTGTNLRRVKLVRTILADLDLREAKGLSTIKHAGPSHLSVDTIYKSEGQIPEVFLRGCGVPEDLIVQIPALVAGMQSIQFYSCFISYSSKDQKFAERLHADLQNKGVRCWYAPEDLKIGEKIRVGIDESIRVHDKLLLILSKNSIGSEWVEKEVEAAMERERRQKRTILFPIRLDDASLKVESGWAADIRRSRNIGDFRRWKSHDTYSKAFEKLIRDLQASG